jgi:hypothetical protein
LYQFRRKPKPLLIQEAARDSSLARFLYVEIVVDSTSELITANGSYAAAVHGGFDYGYYNLLQDNVSLSRPSTTNSGSIAFLRIDREWRVQQVCDAESVSQSVSE